MTNKRTYALLLAAILAGMAVPAAAEDAEDAASSQADAAAEGWPGGDMARKTIEALNDSASGLQAIEWYIQLWDTINAKRGYAWETNPWVWVMAFKVVEVGG